MFEFLPFVIGALVIVGVLYMVNKSRKKGGSSGGGGGGDLPQFIKQAKWFGVPDLMVPPGQIEAFLDFAKNSGCNSMLVKVGQWPLMGFKADGSPQINEAWLERLRWFIIQCDRRELACQECFFDVFDKKAGTKPTNNQWVKDPNQHLLHYGKRDERWEPYLKFICEELLMPYRYTFIDCNEVDAGGRGEMFAENYNQFLKPILDRHAPGKLVGVSEEGAFAAQAPLKQPHKFTIVQAGQFLNEHAGGVPAQNGQPPWSNEAIRDPGNRAWYKNANQMMKDRGARGTCAASWLDISMPLNEAAKGVITDLGAL